VALQERPWAAWLANATWNALPEALNRNTNNHTLVSVPSNQTHSSPKSTSASSPAGWTCGTVTQATPPRSSRRSWAT
jgi:hypothetical protein